MMMTIWATAYLHRPGGDPTTATRKTVTDNNNNNKIRSIYVNDNGLKNTITWYGDDGVEKYT